MIAAERSSSGWEADMAEDATLDRIRSRFQPVYRHCDGCKALLTEELDANCQVCPHCGHHHRISAMARLRLLLDEEPVP